MTQVHALLGQLAVALDLVAVGWTVGLLVTRRPIGTLFLGSIVWVVVVVVLAAALGIATAIFVHPPADLLHLVYGVLAVAVVPMAVAIGAARPEAQRSTVAAVASVVLLILLVRLLQSG